MAGKKRAKSEAAHASGEEYWLQLASDFGVTGAKIVHPSTVVTGNWVRWKCMFGCGGLGSNLMCPPYTPRPAETRAMLDEYERAILFEASCKAVKKIAVKLERELFLSGHYKAFGLGAGPCFLCDKCALDEGCRHPRKARPAMEACGIDVYATARNNGFTIDVVRTCDDPQHYFGLVLIE